MKQTARPGETWLVKQAQRVFAIGLRRVFIACALIALLGCGSLVTLNANRSYYDACNDTKRPSDTQDTFLVDTAYRFGLMALFAEVAYRRDRGDSVKDGEGCRYLDGSPGQESFGMPGGWKRWVPPPLPGAAPPCFDGSGLYYETYIYEDEVSAEAVIAFRGTENRKGQYLTDWGSNVSAALGFEPKQYALANELVPSLVGRLRRHFEANGKEVKIYVTGHSLGGGLAQQAGYLTKDIREVFTFNTSPVTNWSHMRMRRVIRNAYPTFHRIYHGGEFLEKVRFVSTSFTGARYGRHDIGLQLQERAGGKGHSMSIIACNFARLIGSRNPARDAEHHYPVQYIREVVFPKVCHTSWSDAVKPASPNLEVPQEVCK